MRKDEQEIKHPLVATTYDGKKAVIIASTHIKAK